MSWLLAVPTAFAYAAFSGWGIPAQRTCWMLTIAGLALRAGRSHALTHVMALTAAIVCLLDPWAVMSSGFWLSFATVAAIVAAGSPSRPWRARWCDALSAQWAATVVLVPLAAWWFGAIPLFGPLANALAIPLVSAVITPVSMAGAAFGLLSDDLAALCLRLAALAAQGLITAMHWIDNLPVTVLVTGSGSMLALVLACLGVLVVLWPRRPVARLTRCVSDASAVDQR
ncbi:MAG: ComEC/Rec2 family competence protein [Burkholderiaceae bacterium]